MLDATWEPSLTGTELRDLRRRAGLGCVAFGAALGIGGKGRNIARCLRRLEGYGDRRLPDYAIERAEAVKAKLAQLEAEGWFE
jgi:hypothetical protein